MKLLLLLPFLVSCTSMAWQVDDTTTVKSLDNRYNDEVAIIEQHYLCTQGDPLSIGFTFSECELKKYHVWQRYWNARRELYKQQQAR